MDDPIEGLSSAVVLSGHESIFQEVDDIIGRAVTAGDPLLAFQYGERLISDGLLRGLALAKLLYRLNESWELFRAAGTDDELEVMAFVHMGVKPQTTKRYVRMWEAVFANEDISDSTKDLLRGKPIRELLLLTAAVREGQVGEEELREVALGVRDARSAVHEKRGDRTSSASAIHIHVAMVDLPQFPRGTVYARRGNEVEVLFSIDPATQPRSLKDMAYTRLLNSAGVEEDFGL